ncbi:ras-GEF domain-containing family member 1B-A-like [Neosynchiropus ocellatus]
MPQTPSVPGPLGPGGNIAADLRYQDNKLVSGSLEGLVRHLVPTPDYYPDRTFVFTFLLSSRLFLAPHELVTRVGHLCAESQRPGPGDSHAEVRMRRVAPKVVQLLTEWTQMFPYDFRDERMMRSLRELTRRLAGADEACRPALSHMSQGLIRRLTVLNQYQEALVRINATAAERRAGVERDLLAVCSDPFTAAQQLTHIELERLGFIGPEEFVQAFVRSDRRNRGTVACGDPRPARNLESYVDWFNRLSYLVATEICTPVKKKHRVRVIEFFIDVARECFNMGNFNSLMAIISGLNMSPVARLKKTWSKVKTAKFDVLEHQMDPSGNFYNYRTALRGAAHRAATATSGRERVVVPFFGLLIKDLYFLNECCRDLLPDGHLDFQKFWELAKQVSELLCWRRAECPFPKERRTLRHLLTAPVCSEDGLQRLSCGRERAAQAPWRSERRAPRL